MSGQNYVTNPNYLNPNPNPNSNSLNQYLNRYIVYPTIDTKMYSSICVKLFHHSKSDFVFKARNGKFYNTVLNVFGNTIIAYSLDGISEFTVYCKEVDSSNYSEISLSEVFLAPLYDIYIKM